MGGTCSACSDTSSAEDVKKRDQLLPEKQADPTYDIEGRPSESNDGDVSGTTTDLSTFDNLFEDLAKFMKSLPVKSKKHIWEHAVGEKDKKEKKDKTKKVYDKTTKQEQITRLLCDCVIVYIKYLNRKEKPLKTQAVLPFVEPAAKWMFEKHKELERKRFEEENNYFPDMLEEYQHFAK